MTWDAAGLRRLDLMIWSLVAGTAGITLAIAPIYGFILVFPSFIAPAGTCLILILVARYYRDRRADPYLASALASTAQVIAFAAVGAPLSYVAAATTGGWPLQDAAFDAFDRAMRFDWNGLLALMREWPDVHLFMRLIYMSLSVQITAVVLVLGFTGRLAWLRVYTLAFIFAALSCIVISALVPAEGVWMFEGLKHSDPLLPVSNGAWPVYAALRDGSLRLLMARGAEGIITFPSLHAGLAVILIVALWPVRVLRWVSAVLNTLMLVATPIDGAHYLTDVLAGIVVAAVSLLAARALVARFAPQSDTAADEKFIGYAQTPQIAAE